ncbi:MAG: 3-isopropylmalate dehydratase large subunit [bacterium]
MGKTIAEKIFSKKGGQDVHAKDLVLAEVDFCMGQDGTSGIIIDSFREMGAKRVFNPKKTAFIIDHSSPSPNMGVSAIHKKMRDFVNEQGIILYDIGCGVCHQLLPEKGHIVPGDLVIGADSHTCSYGAINVFSTGMGSTDVAVGIISGKNWFRVPETVKFIFKNQLKNGVYSKDLALFIARRTGADGLTYMAAEYTGHAIDKLSVEARFTICNMAIEIGAKAGIMDADEKVINWVKKRTRRKFVPVKADKDAIYADVMEFDAGKIVPQVAKPHAVDNVVDIDDVKQIEIQQGLIGTCTNGRLEDLQIAASILKGKKIKKGLRLIITPASREVFMEAMKKGVVASLLESGGTFVTPGCGPCVGTHNGVPSDGERVISTANRNFKGRMGNPNSEIYLASPATVAASMLTGKITDPRKYIKKTV